MVKLTTLILLIFCLSPCVFGQNNIFRGLVKVQSSGAQPLSGVKISSFGTNSVYTKDNGLFELSFLGKRPGAKLTLIVEKAGYEIINDRELESCFLRENADDIFIIVMAKSGERDRQALRYYNIIINANNKQTDRKLADIQQTMNSLKDDSEERRALRQEIAKLQQDKEDLLERAEDLAKQMAAVDLDQASGLAKKAYDLFANGKIQEAIEVLDDKDLALSLEQAQEERDKAKAHLSKANEAFSQSVENYMIKARFCISDKQHEEALTYYEKAIAADGKNIDNLLEVAKYADGLQRQEIAIKYYSLALAETSDQEAAAALMDELGSQYGYNNEIEKSDSMFSASLALIDKLETNEEKDFSSYRARVLMNRGGVSLKRNKLEDAMEDLQKSLAIITKFATEDTLQRKQDLAVLHQTIGLGNLFMGKYGDCEKSYLKSLATWEELARLDEKKYGAKLALIQMNVGVLYTDFREYNTAEKYYLESLALRERLAEEDPFRFRKALADIQMNLGNLYVRLDSWDKAEEFFNKSKAHFEDLVKENPIRYEHELAMVEMGRGNLYRDLKDYNEAETAYKKSLSIRERLATDNFNHYGPMLFGTYNNLGILYRKMKKTDQSEASYLASLAVIKKLTDGNEKRYKSKLAKASMNLGNLYNEMFLFGKSDSVYLATISIYEELIKRSPERYNLLLGQTLLNVAYMNKNALETNLDLMYVDRAKAALARSSTLLSTAGEKDRLANNLRTHQVKLDSFFKTVTLESVEIDVAMAQAEKMTPDSADYKLGASARKQTEVTRKLAELARKYPKNERLTSELLSAYAKLSWILILNERFEDAEEAASSGLEVEPNHPSLITRVALSKLFRGETAEAGQLMDELLKKHCQEPACKEKAMADFDALQANEMTCEGFSKLRSSLAKE